MSTLLSKFGRTCDTIVAPLARESEKEERKEKANSKKEQAEVRIAGERAKKEQAWGR